MERSNRSASPTSRVRQFTYLSAVSQSIFGDAKEEVWIVKLLETMLFALAWILIPAALMSAALVVGELVKWQRIADRGARRVAR